MARKPTKREREKFEYLCTTHGRNIEDAKCLIAEGRKVGFILSFGKVTSANCVIDEKPTHTEKNPTRNTGNYTLITDGWKVSLNLLLKLLCLTI